MGGADRARDSGGARDKGGSQDSGGAPLLAVIRGNATPEETAALIAVLAARRAAAARALAARSQQPQDNGTLSGWRGSSRRLQPLPRHGPGAWRASGLPH